MQHTTIVHRQTLSILKPLFILAMISAIVCSFLINTMNAASKKAIIPRIDSVNYIGFNVKVPRQIGPGSWYGKQFHNRKTASGQLFDMYGYTAAHRTLPLGSIAKVTSEKTGKSVLVCINDRGPYVHHRIIDLSFHAAGQIGNSLNKLAIEYFTPSQISMLGPLTFNTAKYFGFTSNHQPMIIPLYACTNLEVFKDFSDAIKRQQERQIVESKSGAESVIMIVPDIASKKSRMPKFTFLVSSITSELALSVLPTHE